MSEVVYKFCCLSKFFKLKNHSYIMLKKGNLFFIFLFATLAIFPVASAQSFIGVSEIVSDAVQASTSVFGPLFAGLFGDYSGSEFLFAKVLLFLLLLIILNVVLKKLPLFERQKGIALLVATIISVIAVRFIKDDQFFNGILLPYGTLGVAIWTIFPFIAFFYFLHVTKMGSLGRRIGWAVFSVIWLTIWNARWQDFSRISNQIYFWTFIVMIAVFIWDKRIHAYFGAHELNVFYKGAHQKEIAGLQAEYLQIMNVDTPVAERRRRVIERRLATLGATPT
jgi:hypothetical protein